MGEVGKRKKEEIEKGEERRGRRERSELAQDSKRKKDEMI
jgi:hypothetical protein